MKVFFDSSAFAKRYINEKESDRIDKIVLQATDLAISIICVPEIISALSRLKRESKITQHQYQVAKKSLIADIADINVCQLTVLVVKKSIDLLECTVLRAMDSLHVACAMEWQTDLFVSADQRQLEAAKKARLTVCDISLS